jgi:hypothetical protein
MKNGNESGTRSNDIESRKPFKQKSISNRVLDAGKTGRRLILKIHIPNSGTFSGNVE